MSKLNATAIIAARANSKGIKDKNLQHIDKKNLVQISIEQGLKTCEIVILSSDSHEIREVGREYKDVFIVERNLDILHCSWSSYPSKAKSCLALDQRLKLFHKRI